MKQTYMDQLARTARWRLPPAEAKEVLEDYQDLLAQDPRSEEALRREVGEPAEVVRQLEQGKSYRRWLAVYVLGLTVMVLGVAVLALLSSMNLDVTAPGWWMPVLPEYLVITGLGLVGTGVSLC